MEDYQTMRYRSSIRYLMGVLALLLVSSACSSSDTGSESAVGRTERESVTVEPDFSLSPFVVNVALTDTGPEPDVIFIPAGRQIRLVLRNHGTTEHHFLIRGLVPALLRWRVESEVDAYELDSLSPGEQAELGIDIAGVTDEAEMEHLLHHLAPSWAPTKAESPSGIKPVGLDVHGYVSLGTNDVLTFFALQTGEYVSEDVLYPELTGRVVVFAPSDTTTDEG